MDRFKTGSLTSEPDIAALADRVPVIDRVLHPQAAHTIALDMDNSVGERRAAQLTQLHAVAITL
jgi:hypothetical protein